MFPSPTKESRFFIHGMPFHCHQSGRIVVRWKRQTSNWAELHCNRTKPLLLALNPREQWWGIRISPLNKGRRANHRRGRQQPMYRYPLFPRVLLRLFIHPHLHSTNNPHPCHHQVHHLRHHCHHHPYQHTETITSRFPCQPCLATNNQYKIILHKRAWRKSLH